MELLELMYCMIIFVVPLMGIIGMAIFQLLCRLLLSHRVGLKKTFYCTRYRSNTS